ncbi:MAG: hypothetical protein QM702_04415 [Rubrivivax sp.]
MKLQLIPEARRWWRMFSMQAMALANAILAAWLAVPAALQERVPAPLVIGTAIALLVLGMVGRLVHQGSLRTPGDEASTS